MTGSVAIDVVIGLVFIYLLYSLLATVMAEIIAIHLGLRARNLQQAIRRMLEDTPQASETKVIAFIKHILISISQVFVIPEGPAACVFYHLPVIKYMGRNTLYSKPSYISSQNFSKAIMEIFRRYGGDENKSDLEKIQNVLKGALEYPGVLREIKEEINTKTKVDPQKLDQKIDYKEIRDSITEKINALNAHDSLDSAQLRLLIKIKKLLDVIRTEKLDKMVVYRIDEMLNLFGHETRGHLRSLLIDANNDLVKFRSLLEIWFDDTMDRATGWYKQKIQFVLLLVGLVLALWFNASTLVIVRKLSIDKDARTQLVQMTSDFIKDPINKLPEGLTRFTYKDSLRVDSVRKVRLDSLEKVRTRLQQEMNDANNLLGIGWLDLPDSLSLVVTAKEDSLNKLAKIGALHYRKILLATQDGSQRDQTEVKDLERFLVYSGDATKYIVWCLAEKQNGKFWKEDRYIGCNKSFTKIDVDNSLIGQIQYVAGHLFSSAFWGYLLTAIAISLGAPFWFDMLNKLMQIRGVFKESVRNAK